MYVCANYINFSCLEITRYCLNFMLSMYVCMYVCICMYVCVYMYVSMYPSIKTTIRERNFDLYREVSLSQGIFVLKKAITMWPF